jgi:hypothetical protein
MTTLVCDDNYNRCMCWTLCVSRTRFQSLSSRAALAVREDVYGEEEALGTQASFREEIDSRHWFRSTVEQAVYNNREKTRDAFARLQSDYARRLQYGDDASEAWAALALPVRLVVAHVLPPNFGWFAAFFQQELLKSCWRHTNWLLDQSDTRLQDLAKDKEKLHKLEDRRRVAQPVAVPHTVNSTAASGSSSIPGTPTGASSTPRGIQGAAASNPFASATTLASFFPRPPAWSSSSSSSAAAAVSSLSMAGPDGDEDDKSSIKSARSAVSDLRAMPATGSTGAMAASQWSTNNTRGTNSIKSLPGSAATPMAWQAAPSRTMGLEKSVDTTPDWDPALVAAWTPPDLARLFPDMQAFFLMWLERADSFRFHSQLTPLLAAKIVELCDLEQVDDVGRTFAARVLKLKLVARFLGAVTFSPQWAPSTLAATSTPFLAVVEDAAR